MKFTCPHCDGELAIEPVGLKGPARSSSSDITPLTDQALRDVYDLMALLGPVRWTSIRLYAQYLKFCEEIDRKVPLTKNAFARALRRNGAAPWRTSYERGYQLPDGLTKPATMTHEQRERFEAAHQRQAVRDHIGGDGPADAPNAPRGSGRPETAKPKPDYSELPFEIDLEDQSYTPGGEVDPTAGEPDDVQARIDAGLPPF